MNCAPPLVVRRQAKVAVRVHRDTSTSGPPRQTGPDRSGAVSMAPQCGLHTHSGRAQWPLIKSRSARSHDRRLCADGQEQWWFPSGSQ